MNDGSLESLANDVMIMKKAFGEEKARWRREASQIEGALKEFETLLKDTVTKDIKTEMQKISEDVITLTNAVSNIKTSVDTVKNVVSEVKTNMDSSNDKMKEEMLALKESLKHVVANSSQTTWSTEQPATQTALTQSPQTQQSHCLDLYNDGQRYSGAYTIYPEPDKQPLLVYCDMDTDGGGWTVFQRRQDGSENFYRGWEDYASGFGDVENEFWLGNKYISQLTGLCCNELRVDLEDENGKKTSAKYRSFRVLPSGRNYTLEIGAYSGDAEDKLTYQNVMQFSTTDRDNDKAGYNCAKRYEAAWWYKTCFVSNLNGKYSSSKLYWYYKYKLVWTEMKFRPA